MALPLNRRKFFAGALAAAPLMKALGASRAEANDDPRSQAALDVRKQSALEQSKRPIAPMKANGDEDALPNRIACFAKGLPQDPLGNVDSKAYEALLTALKSHRHSDFEQIPRAGGRRLNNPEAAFTFHLEGGDPHTFDIPPAPSITSEVASWETSELYWQALCRDVPFAGYDESRIVRQAADHLKVGTGELFRGRAKGNVEGPYVSQFLLKPIPFGSGKVEQRYRVPVEGSDFMTAVPEWTRIQAGTPPWRAATYDPTPRFIRNGRDLAEYVHYDFTYQAYLSAALILMNSGPGSILNCNQFKGASNPYRYSTVQEGFVTFGQAEVVDWLGRVTTAALKAAYCQKWMVHRRLRPEALGGLIQQNRVGIKKNPVHKSLVHSRAVDNVFSRTGTYLLPQAYPEGCPLHPSYPSGHAAIAGACSVVLKACFDSSMLLPGAVEASSDGLTLKPLSNYSPTVGDEINKLAFNIAMGRNWAGIHYRSDADAGLRLGEDVGISIVQDLVRTYTEDFGGFLIKRFDGTQVRITPQGEAVEA